MSNLVKVKIVPYQSTWPVQFAQESQAIQKALGDNCVAVHHIGSTSVPGLSAKPIIDILPVVKDITQVDHDAMHAIDYEGRGELGMMFRRYFSKGSGPIRSYHVHIWQEGSAEIDKHLRFRQYLIDHPAAARQYETLKCQLADQYAHDRAAYTAAKDTFISSILDQAGFTGFVIVQPATAMQWSTYHRLRRDYIFEPINIVYDPQHWTLSAPQHYHYILLKGTQIVGCCQVELLPDHAAILRTIIIDPIVQRLGYGAYLLQQIERWIIQQGKTALYLHSRKSAVPFYSRCGYQPMNFDDEGALARDDRIDLGKILSTEQTFTT